MAVSVFTQSRHQNADMSGINITPLVDVLLVLLVIFMMQSLPRSQGIEIDLPSAGESQAMPLPRTLLSVGTDGRIQMEGASIAPADLRSELAALKRRAPNTILAMEASGGAGYGLFARALADARNAGFADVALRP